MIKPCSKCFDDAPKYKRMKLRKNGKRTLSVASYCVICHNEDQKIREERRYEKKLAYNREWKRRMGRKYFNKLNRKYYLKNKDRINQQRKLKCVHSSSVML